MNRFRCAIVVAALSAGVALPAHAAPGDLEGPRLDGTYDVDYKRKTFDPQVWRITATCGEGACDANVKGTDVSGRLRYRAARETYVIKNKYKGGICTRKNPDTGKREVVLRDSLTYYETISFDRFRGGTDGNAARKVKGVVDAIAKPTRKAKRLGCKNSLTQRTVTTLTLR